jgi:CheY-like chemotaxis protein
LDDDPLDARLLQDVLHDSMNCRVTVVDSKPALLLNLWKELPDVVISDTNIPGFSGLMALEMMRTFYPEIPFVICSGNDSPEERAKAMASGAKAWVTKTNHKFLLAVVNHVCVSRTNKNPAGNDDGEWLIDSGFR